MDTARGNGSNATRAGVDQLRAAVVRGDHDDVPREVHEVVKRLAAERVGRKIVVKYGTISVKMELRVASASHTFAAAEWAFGKIRELGMADAPHRDAWFDRFEWLELCARVLFCPDSGDQLYRNGDALSDSLPERCITQICDEYTDLVSTLDELDPKMLEQVTDLLKKKEWKLLNGIVPLMPRTLLDTTASQLLSCLAIKSSTTDSSAENLEPLEKSSEPDKLTSAPDKQPSELPSDLPTDQAGSA